MNEVARRNVNDKLPAAAKLPEPEIDYDNLVPHELANLLPMTSPEEFERLKRSIAAEGIHEAITIWNDGSGWKILDGRNRHRAAKEAGHVFTSADFKIWTGATAEAKQFVFSKNLARRQLTSKQRFDIIKAEIDRDPEAGNRALARLTGFSHVTIGDVREKIKNPPEQKRFDEFKKDWKRLSEVQQTAFVSEYRLDIRDMLEGG